MTTRLRPFSCGVPPRTLTQWLAATALFYIALVGKVDAQTIWTKWTNAIPPASNISGTEGRIPLGTSGGDADGALTPTVIRDGSIYRMWYAGSAGGVYRIYAATSPDGLTWTKMTNGAPANSDASSSLGRVPLGTAGKGDASWSVHPCVIKDGSIYRMWYAGLSGANTYRIYAATSTDAVVWYKVDNSIPEVTDTTSTNRIPLGTAGKGDVTHTFAPAVVKIGSLYWMWYGGFNGTIQNTLAATSSDAIVWTKINNAVPIRSDTTSTDGSIPRGVTSGKGDYNIGTQPASIIKDDAVYRLWYGGSDGTGRMYYATSPDGLNWTKFNSAIPTASDTNSTGGRIPVGTAGKGDTGDLADCSVIREGAVFKMWYSATGGSKYRIFYATSPADGPTISNDSAIATGPITAGLVGNLIATGAAPAQVCVFWGTNDGGFVSAQWQGHSALAAKEPGLVTNTAHDLTPLTLYYYRFYATNAVGEDWSDSANTFNTTGSGGTLFSTY